MPNGDIDLLVLSIVVAYLALMLLVGWYASTKISAHTDFLVAGRRLGPIMMAGTLAATEIGGGSSMGVAEKAFGHWGMSACWYVLAMGVTFFLLAFIAPRLRQALVNTVPEYFCQRYGRSSSVLTIGVFIFPLVGLTAVQIIASATIVTVMLNIDYAIAVVFIGMIVIAYSILGGLWSVTLTDIVQLVFIVLGMSLAIPFALNAAGGWDNVWNHIPASKASVVDGVGWQTMPNTR